MCTTQKILEKKSTADGGMVQAPKTMTALDNACQYNPCSPCGDIPSELKSYCCQAWRSAGCMRCLVQKCQQMIMLAAWTEINSLSFFQVDEAALLPMSCQYLVYQLSPHHALLM